MRKCYKISGEPCHPYEPFKCPGNGACISIQYLCDGAPDCPDGYDEDARLCTAGNIYFLYIIHVYLRVLSYHSYHNVLAVISYKKYLFGIEK